MNQPVTNHSKKIFSPSFFLLLLIGVFVFSTVPALQVKAQGNLMIMPKRMVFEGSKKSHELNLANTGQDTSRYVITMIHYRMNEDGSFQELAADDTSGNFADKFVRYFPRTVTLGPNESQTLRVQLTQTGKLLPGEYRSHFYFRAVPNEMPRGEKEIIKKEDSNTISVKLVPVFGISIPVIIKVGESTTKVGLSNCSLEMFDATIPLLKMTINRTGNMSAYGDITVDHISPEGKITKVGSVQGLAVYTPIEKRHVKLELKNAEDVDYKKGKLHVVYKAQENVNQNNIAQAEVYLK